MFDSDSVRTARRARGFADALMAVFCCGRCRRRTSRDEGAPNITTTKVQPVQHVRRTTDTRTGAAGDDLASRGFRAEPAVTYRYLPHEHLTGLRAIDISVARLPEGLEDEDVIELFWGNMQLSCGHRKATDEGVLIFFEDSVRLFAGEGAGQQFAIRYGQDLRGGCTPVAFMRSADDCADDMAARESLSSHHPFGSLRRADLISASDPAMRNRLLICGPALILARSDWRVEPI